MMNAMLSLMAATNLVMATIPNFGPDFNASVQDNMNGEYVLSTTPGATPGLFPKKYKDYPGGAESFDVYTPAMTTLYSQVWWSPLAPAPFPDYIVKKYAGKGMAIVGWEIDQVRRTPEGDVSVPISATYNHHYVSQIIGASAKFKKVMLDGPDDPRAASIMNSSHGMVAWDMPHYIAEQTKPSASGQPVHTVSSSANGGEYRKTFHGYAPGYALVIDSPTDLQVTPMQIDTWNRDKMDISGPLPPKFVPGPMPAASQMPLENPAYSGLLECPLTTRITKQIAGTYVVQGKGMCGEPILTFQECYHAAASTLGGGGRLFVNATATDAAKPPGCTVTVDPATPLKVSVLFNRMKNSTAVCAADAATVEGASNSLVSLTVALSQNATITMVGPSTVWFGVGFGARSMGDAPWTVVVDGNGTVSERKLGNHLAGTLLASSVHVISSTMAKGQRTVVLTRPLKGLDGDYFTFSIATNDTTIPIITAVGSTAAFGYHKDKTLSTIALLPTGATAAGACVCPEQPKPFGAASGEMVYHANVSQPFDTGEGSVGFGAGKCAPFPATVLNEMRNPTCDIRHYVGGQWACHHMWSLLDAEQDIPWTDKPLVFHHKYRFWVQPFVAEYHQPLHYGFGAELVIGSPYEYDVPKCAEGVPGCAMVDGTWIHTITGAKMGNYNFTALNFHCHAPTCLSMAVYTCPKGTALPDCNTSVGTLICEQRPVYGGSGSPALNGTRFDEPGYIAIPDCLWGSKDQGLVAPLDLVGVPLFMVKTANASNGHYGDMAGGQPFVY